MHLGWLTLGGFRSYGEIEWRPGPGVNVLVGVNGAGKTNLLEAVGYLASLKSFRGAPDDALVDHTRDSAVVRGGVVHDSAETLIELEIRRRGPRRALVNRQRLERTSDLLGVIRVVAFLPDDLDIVKRGPAHRRDVFDEIAVQLWPGSHLDQAEYDRALRQRNSFLKQGSDDALTLSVWDERLAQAGGKTMARRARAVAAIRPHLADACAQIAGVRGGEIEVGYRSDWGGGLDPAIPAAEYTEKLAQALESRRRVDRERRMTTVGPHRDEPTLLLDGHDLRYHGSQGEQRTVALGLRVAAHRAVVEVTGTAPLLLLDDVFSELDVGRGEALTKALPAAQTLVTTAHPGDVPLTGAVWTVVDGKVLPG